MNEPIDLKIQDFGHFDVTQNIKNQPLSLDKSFVVVFQLKRMIKSL